MLRRPGSPRAIFRPGVPGMSDRVDTPARQPLWWLTPAAAVALAAIIAFVYWPALRHFPHSDQCNFFLDTIEYDGFRDLAANSYSFTRTRVHAGGDTQLFRPVLFIGLAALQAFCGLHWEWCQAITIALHIAACLLLLLLLRHLFRRAQPSDAAPFWSPFTYLPYALVFFFALNYAIVEQVIWYHIQGYLLALVL